MIAGERFLFRGRTVWKLDYGEEYVKKVSSRRNETEKVSVLLHPLSISLFLWTKNNKSSRNRFRSPPLRNNRINAGYPDGGFSAGVCLFRRLRRREHYSAPDLLAGLVGCQPSGGQSRKEYSECPDFLGDLYGCGLSFMFDPDRVRARPRGGYRLDRFLHYRCRQGGERELRLGGSLHD